ncbi:D-isomer specific 2-hydroxyacid dehydrogenase, NAD-binding domain conserved site 1 [Phytophthora cactorum]|nr:D-isomer specific 2-hydroxyacid dehydrogenase, NAD-binding domain conserved site 1 [Phytophthora cactorum]
MHPCVVGHEIVGEVTLGGDQVKGMKFPDEPCKECANGTDAYCRYHVGTYNSKTARRTAPSRTVDTPITSASHTRYAFKIPDNIPSTWPRRCCAPAPQCSRRSRRWVSNPVTRVGIVGVGGLGHLGIQFAKAMGAAAVVAFSRSASKEQEIRRLGADEFVVYTDEKQAADAANSVDILLITADANNMPYICS